MKNRLLILASIFMMKFIYASSFHTDITIDTTTVINNTETYSVYHDDTYIYLSINTIDPKITSSILRQGITVYFDVKGRNKKNVSITYPIIRNQRPPRRNEDRVQETRGFKEDSSLIEQIDHMLQNDPPQKALYTYYDNSKEFNTLLNNEGISINLDLDKEENNFLYSLKIPKLKINDDPDFDFNKLTIGVITAETSRNESKEARPSNGQQSARGGGRGGRPRGGGSQGRSGNGPSGNQGRSRGGEPSPKIQLDFWFKAKLK
ncbi:hypothetical protein [uncultured Aquimarina sp.]|uniref:hypothetical protein n=1 Tax=uncultured Aquimarina sp. TaxID=575652 RepID=UPI002624CB8B|nr:hypothetical protein [uncultured Aquimarina sp.]